MEQEFSRYYPDTLIANGLRREYYESGNVKSELYYKKGREDSISKYYNEKGIVKAIKYKAENIFSGPQYEFYENGAIKGIAFVNMENKVWFDVRYDANGNMKMSGKPLNVIFDPRRGRVDSVIAGQNLVVLNEVPLIYKARTRLRIELQKDGKVLYDTTVTEFMPLYNIKIFGYAEKLDKPGIYNYVGYTEFLDSATGRIIKEYEGTLPIKVYDRPKK